MPVFIGFIVHGVGTRNPKTGFDLLAEAVRWGQGLDEFDEHVRAATVVLARPRKVSTDRTGSVTYVEVDETERDYLVELVNEAVEYWLLCDYGDDDNPDWAWLGQVSESGGIASGLTEGRLLGMA